jgi:hypothetical protein
VAFLKFVVVVVVVFVVVFNDVDYLAVWQRSGSSSSSSSNFLWSESFHEGLELGGFDLDFDTSKK